MTNKIISLSERTKTALTFKAEKEGTSAKRLIEGLADRAADEFRDGRTDAQLIDDLVEYREMKIKAEFEESVRKTEDEHKERLRKMRDRYNSFNDDLT